MSWKRLLDEDDQIFLSHTTVSGAYTVADDVDLVFVSATATITFPDAASWAGREIHVKSFAVGVVVTIDSDGGLIDGETTQEIGDFDSIAACSNGTDWGVL